VRALIPMESQLGSRVLLMSEPSTASGDGDSDTDEVDQIRATPAPALPLYSDRPVSKRKESDWNIEPAPKRAKHEQSHHIRDNSRQGNQSTGAFTRF
jgi:hypothetical protein